MGAVTYCFPVSIGDTVYTEGGGKAEPCVVTGFQVLEHGVYVYVRYPGLPLNQPVLLAGIHRFRDGTENNLKEKEEQTHEESTDGRA